MKSYTNLEQSKKLAEFLPLKSADVHWQYIEEDNGQLQWFCFSKDFSINQYDKVPAWSLTALLNVLPKEIEIDGQGYAPCLFPVQDKWLLKLWYNSNYTFTSPIAIFSDNLIDACVEMIIKLHERNLL